MQDNAFAQSGSSPTRTLVVDIGRNADRETLDVIAESAAERNIPLVIMQGTQFTQIRTAAGFVQATCKECGEQATFTLGAATPTVIRHDARCQVGHLLEWADRAARGEHSSRNRRLKMRALHGQLSAKYAHDKDLCVVKIGGAR